MRNRSRSTQIQKVAVCLAVASLALVAPAIGGEIPADDDTLLLLRFDGNLTGVAGELPDGQVLGVTYAAGIQGQGAYLQPGNRLYYLVEENLDPTAGTLEFWIQPRWDGNDGQDHYALRASWGGGILIGKDGGNYWRSIFNRWVGGGEVGAGVNVNGWVEDAWHHAAFTWTSDRLEVYVDGTLVTSSPAGSPLSTLPEDVFQIGGDGEGGYLDAVVDELRISRVARTAEEIEESYTTGLPVDGLVITPDSTTVLETWWWRPELFVMTSSGPSPLPSAAADWATTNPSVAVVRPDGVVVALAAGDATITASYEGHTAVATISVTAPLLGHQVEAIDPYLASPAGGARHEIPVAILRYLPTDDGVNVDPAVTGWNGSLADMEARIDNYDLRVKFGLEEGSRFRGYANPSALPSLGYRVVKIITVYEPLPKSQFEIPWNAGWYRPDYNQILDRWNAEDLVNNLGVKEIWLWGYHSDGIEPAESNMSSPLTGDVSNSERHQDDLPIFDHTYTLYNYNFTRSAAEALHDHGHQLEAILGWANQRQDGDTELFWDRFVGRDENGHLLGRCGWTHMPPNSLDDYDYYNPLLVESDCTDWRPDGSGELEVVNVDTWTDLEYDWPAGGSEGLENRSHSQFLVWWWQNMPGRDSRIPHGSFEVTNWWQFTADWDAAVLGDLGLYGDPVPPDSRGDTDGDGRSDFLLRSTDGSLRLWQMDGTDVLDSVDLPLKSTEWVLAGVGDFDADGKNDILWRHRYTGTTELWLMDGAVLRESGPTTLQYDGLWRIQGVGDLDGDDRADIVWLHADGGLAVWQMEGFAVDDARGLPPSPSRSTIVGIADMDGDGRDDILWRGRVSGAIRLWLMAGAAVRQDVSLAPWVHASWQVAGLGDLNGDGRSDVIWRHSRGLSYAWLMGDATVETAAWLPRMSRTWKVDAVGDFDGDGRDDIAWRSRYTGTTYLWLMDSTTVEDRGYTSLQLDGTWTIESPRALAQPPERLEGSPVAASSSSRRTR